VVGDRWHALIEEETGLVASAKHPRKWGRLLRMAAGYRPDDRLAITLPDGATVWADDPFVDVVLSRAVGRGVRLARTRPDGAMLERLTPPVEASAGALTRRVLAAGTPGETFVDFAAVHLLTTATLDALASAHPRGTVDARRFRPNIVVRMFEERPFVENTWPGRTLSIGADAAVGVVAPTPRCAVPTLAHGIDLAEDHDVLRTAARVNRTPVLDLGALTCVGAYASVAHGGRLRLGDLVRVA
jgi:uncharacterized protein